MKRRAYRGVSLLSVCSVLCGCTAPTFPSTDLTLSPKQILRALNARKLSARGDKDPLFGLTELKALLRPAIERCRAEGADIVVLGRSEIRFAAKPNGAGLRQAQLLLPSRLGCITSGVFLWGLDLEYAEPMFFPSQWAGDMYYYANMRLGFVSGTSLEQNEATSATNRDAAHTRNDECSARRIAYTQRLRADPQVGMVVAYGTIVDLRPPLALIQYSASGLQMKGRDQEWVQISSLSAGTECPS